MTPCTSSFISVFTALFLTSFLCSCGKSTNSIEVKPQSIIHTETFGKKDCALDSKYWSEDESGFNKSEYSPSTTALPFLQTPASPSGGCIAHYFMRAGTDELIPFRVQKDGEYEEIFVRFFMYFKPGFKIPGGLKLARFGNRVNYQNLSSTFFFEYNYSAGSPNIVTYVYNHETDSSPWIGNFNYRFPEDKWIMIELFFKASNPNQDNGRAMIWIDGDLVKDSGDILTRTRDLPNNYFWVGGNHSWGGGTGEGGMTNVPEDSSLYFDQIEIFNTLPPEYAEHSMALRFFSAM